MKRIITVTAVILSMFLGTMFVEAGTTDFVKVIALQDVTIGITSDGEVKAVGNEAKKIVKQLSGKGPFTNIYGDSVIGLTDEGKVASVYALWGDDKFNESGPYTCVADGIFYVAGLKEDGTVVAVSDYMNEKELKFPWENIVALSELQVSTYRRTCGLKKDGTIVIAGRQDKEYQFADAPENFKDIKKIAAGYDLLAGLKNDGTVTAYDFMFNKAKELPWTDIVDIAASNGNVYGLKEDGTVLGFYFLEDKEIDMSEWTDIVSISASDTHIVALRKDGKVLAKGNNDNGQCDVNSWDLTPLKGDANDDNLVTADDALEVLKVAAKLNNYGNEFTPGKWSPENVGSEIVTAEDALEILKIAAKIK